MSVEQHDAFVIHMRKYTDTRVILELLTRERGLVSVVQNKSPYKNRQFGEVSQSAAIVQLFTPYFVEYRGRSGLKTLNFIELAGAGISLRNKNLFCGFYVNEIIQRCLAQGEMAESLFELYGATISALSQCDYEDNPKYISIVLRKFELGLLAALGYAINFTSDINHQPIINQPGVWYRFIPGEGFCFYAGQSNDLDARSGSAAVLGFGSANLIPAAVVTALENGDFQADCGGHDVEHYARRLCRLALRPILGEKPIKSRELFGS